MHSITPGRFPPTPYGRWCGLCHATVHGGAALALLLCAAVPTLAVPPAGAQAVAMPQAAAPLEELIISARRLPRPPGQTLAAFSVLERADIERLQALDLFALLGRLPGVQLSRNGGRGSLVSLFLRGSESNHVLVLVDGVRIDSAASGLASLEALPLADIERIEVVRGPRSALYGSQALGGVVQIFSRRGRRAGLGVELGVGSHHRAEAGASIDWTDSGAWFSASLRHADSQGIDHLLADGHPDRDAARHSSLRLAAGYDDERLGRWQLQHISGRAELENDVLPFPPFVLPSASAGSHELLRLAHTVLAWDWSPREAWSWHLDAGHSRDWRESFGPYPGRYDSRRRSLAWWQELRLGERGGRLALGGDHHWESLSGSYAASRRSDGIFLHYQGDWGPLGLALALRHDDDGQYGERQTFSADAVWQLPRGIAAGLSWGQAFTAPSFNDLYFPGFSNPTLRPETSRSLELRLSGAHGGIDWALAAFHQRTGQLISFNPASNRPENIARAQIDGLELEAHGVAARWQWGVAATLLRPRDLDSGRDLLRRARYRLSVDLDRALGPWSFGGGVACNGPRRDFSRQLAGHTLWHLRASRRLSSTLRVELALENALNRDWEPAEGYQGQPLGAFLRLRYRQPLTGR